MLLATSNPVFVVYTITTLVLVAHLLFLWNYSGIVRGKVRITPNAEDAKRWGSTLGELEPPEIARVVRVYQNASAATYAFLLVALVFVALGGGLRFAEITFGIFVGARLIYSVVYLAGAQPWRTVFFTIGLGATLTIMGQIVHLLVHR